jgi:hypothetical protein
VRFFAAGAADEVQLGSAGYRTSPEYGAPVVPPRKELYGGSRGALAVVRTL